MSGTSCRKISTGRLLDSEGNTLNRSIHLPLDVQDACSLVYASCSPFCSPSLVVHLASQGPAESTGSTMQPPVTTPLSAELPSRGDAMQLASRKAQLRMRGATGPLHAAGRSALGTHLSCWCCCQAEKAATSAESESISSRSAPEAYCRAGTAQSSGTHIALYRAAVHACRATPAPVML